MSSSSQGEGSGNKKQGLKAAVRKAMIIDKLTQGQASNNPGIVFNNGESGGQLFKTEYS